jgi:hypothetical protein
MLRVAEVIFNNTPSQFNKDLTEFLKRNIKNIIQRGMIKFKFVIAHNDDLPKLRNNGIKRLPVMLVDGKQFTSVPLIIDELQKRVKFSKGAAAPKSDEETLNDYFKSALGNIKTDRDGKIDTSSFNDDEEEDMGNKLMEAATKEATRRNIKGDTVYTQKNAPVYEDTCRQQANKSSNQQYNQQYSQQYKQERPDNVQNKDAGDPMRALTSMRSKGEKSPDDDLMAALLEKMGSD